MCFSQIASVLHWFKKQWCKEFVLRKHSTKWQIALKCEREEQITMEDAKEEVNKSVFLNFAFAISMKLVFVFIKEKKTRKISFFTSF